MNFIVFLILAVSAVVIMALVDRRSRRARGLPTLDSYPGHITDFGPDTDRIREEVQAVAAHEKPVVDTRHGFPGPGWIGVR